MTEPVELVNAADVFAEDLKDPAFRAEWERTALAREVALALVRYRVDRGLTQTALAALLGMKQPAIARMESGDVSPSFETLQRIARTLGLTFELRIAPEGTSVGVAAPASTADTAAPSPATPPPSVHERCGDFTVRVWKYRVLPDLLASFRADVSDAAGSVFSLETEIPNRTLPDPSTEDQLARTTFRQACQLIERRDFRRGGRYRIPVHST